MMKSVHFANGFKDERLKRVAFILTDEIEKYLTLNIFLDHDASVEFFNNKITSADFVINAASLVEAAFESLCICKVLPLFCYRNVAKQTIVERLRLQEKNDIKILS